MFQSFIVELVLGGLFVLALLGIVVAAFTEAVLAYTEVRSKNLETWLRKFVSDMSEGSDQSKLNLETLWKSPWLAPLRGSKDGAPSFIPPKLLAQALLDLVVNPARESMVGKPLADLEKEIRNRVAELKAPGLSEALSGMLDVATASAKDSAELLENLKKQCAQWIDNAMDRVQGWTKRHAKIVSLIISSLLCLGLNVNIVTVISTLANNPDTRAKYAEKAYNEYTEALEAEESKRCAGMTVPEQQGECLRLLGQKKAGVLASFNDLGIGWAQRPRFLSYSLCATPAHFVGYFLFWLLGIAATVFAASLGGEFWFKMIGEVIRLTGYKPGGAKDAKPKPSS